MVILALEFFSWYISNRNFVVLLYGVSSVITSISIASSLVFFTIILLGTPAEVMSPSELTSEQEEVGHSEQEEVGHSEQEEVGHSEQEEVGHSEQEEVGHSEQEEVGPFRTRRSWPFRTRRSWPWSRYQKI